ncbi:MAG: NAD+ synthase [Methanobrevibacter sp.]|jgi:NAD+ synthase|nr:NAD+ synthase [Candidatus Methanovirga meridionalis]
MSVLAEIDSKIVKLELIAFIKKIVAKSNCPNMILGLSGGIDSSIVAYLLKEAISVENIYTYHLHSSTTPKEDTTHARLIAKKFNLNYDEISIDGILDKYLDEFCIDSYNGIDLNDNENFKLTLGNLKARIRMSILYYFANLKNGLVAGTGNRSELLIGYMTKFGDGACDFELIGDIYKSQLKNLAESWEIPIEIINKPPRAGLWNNQTDEEEIGMNYDILDQVIYLIEDKKLKNNDILNKIDVSPLEINMIRDKITNNRHKIQVPLSPFANKKLFD